MNDGLGVQDENEIITYANDTLCEMWGYSRDEIIGHSVMAFLDEANRNVMKEQLERRRKGENETYEIVWTRKDKRKISTLTVPSPLFDIEGNFKGSFAVITDVTDRKKAEEELHKLSQFQESIIDNANIWLNVLDVEENVLIWNKAAEEISGYSRDEVVGHGTIWEWLYPDKEYRNEIAAKASSIIERGELVEGFKTTILCKKGEKRVISWNSRNMVDENGNVIGSIALGRDITEQLQLEEQLRQSQKMEAVGLLAGGVAHDFNNLLTAMIGYSDILTGDLDLDDHHRKYVGEIRKSADRAAKLTNQLLAFSRKQILKPKILNLNRLVTDVKKMLMRLIGENIRLVSKHETGLGVIKADPGQVEQIIMNIAVNARDAMPEGGELRLDTRNVYLDDRFIEKHKGVKAGFYVSLKISDTGAGMDKETRDRIFEPFFTTKETGKGTGLGLSMVYGIVKQSGGYIFVESEQNKGTEFNIYFPRVEEVDEGGGMQREKKGILKGSETILIVEDEEMVRNLIFESLRIFGYDLIEAENGEKALNVYNKNNERPIHLLITDVIMPDMGGWELAKKLEKLKPDMKVLYISGYTDEAMVHHRVLDEGVAFLQKPFSPQILAKKVREILGGG
jgi:PAS domain S-box-containing protein